MVNIITLPAQKPRLDCFCFARERPPPPQYPGYPSGNFLGHHRSYTFCCYPRAGIWQAEINRIQGLPGTAILAEDYINPNMASKLKLANIQFIDTAGNAFINLEPLYILITGKKLQREKTEKTSGQVNRAFEPKGLLVTYAILTNQELLNDEDTLRIPTARIRQELHGQLCDFRIMSLAQQRSTTYSRCFILTKVG